MGFEEAIARALISAGGVMVGYIIIYLIIR